MNRCVLLCASPFTDINFVNSQITPDDFIVCADGGYSLAQKLSIVPNLLVGDFDSIESTDNLKAEEIIELPKFKDDTDTVFALKTVISRGFKDILILGGTGGRLDHTLANLSVLKFLYENNCKCTIKDPRQTIFYTEDEFSFNSPNKTVSIFAFACESSIITLNNFRYPLDKYKLMANMPLGISNVTLDTSILKVHSGGVLVVVNNMLCEF